MGTTIQLVSRTTPDTSVADAYARYAAAARDAGCPADQIRNFARGRVILQPRQLIASAAARLCDLPDGPTSIAYGGARSGGKSFWELAQLFLDDCARYPGLKCLMLRKVGKAAREATNDLRKSVLHSTAHTWKAQDGILIRDDNGSRVHLGHFQNDRDIDNYLGLEYDVIAVEEATQLAVSKIEDIETCLRSSKPGWRPRAYYSTNPGGRGHAWFKARFIEPNRKGTETDTRFIKATIRDNRFIDAQNIKKLEVLSGWKRKAWLDGDWDIAVGQFFENWDFSLHVRKKEFLDYVERGWTAWLSLDYGFNHYTVSHLFVKTGDGVVRIIDEHAARKWLPAQHVDAIKEMVRRHGLQIGDLRRVVAGGDVFAKDRDGRSPSDDYKALGLTLQMADMGRISGAAEFIKRLGDPENQIPPTLVISDRCKRLIEQLPAMQHDESRSEDVQKVDCDADGRGGDDAYDSARYGLMDADRASGGWVRNPGGR